MTSAIKFLKATTALFLVQLLAISNAFAACVAVDGGIQTQTLFAGQTIDAGTVTTQVVGDDLQISYNTTGGWQLVETHAWAGNDIADMPQTRKGTPKLGNFPYNSGDITGATNYVVNVPLDVLGFTCPSVDAMYYVATHAALQLVNAGGDVVQTETGWADGDRFVEKGMWGTFFNVTLSCDCGSEPPTTGNGQCETAFAFGGGTNAIDADFTNSFLEIDEDGDTVGDFNRWGWSNGAIGVGNYVWDVYAGAGQSDINKGTLVGTLTVDYNGSSANVSFNTIAPYSVEETHVYVGSEILPRDGNGNYTVAPGQYPQIHEDLGVATSDSYVFNGLSGNIYVVAHAVACGF
jgi:hypothetical protein